MFSMAEYWPLADGYHQVFNRLSTGQTIRQVIIGRTEGSWPIHIARYLRGGQLAA